LYSSHINRFSKTSDTTSVVQKTKLMPVVIGDS
jgi:hypothetical protein